MSGTFFFTSDQHFGHRLLAELRGFDSIAEHDDAILTAYNSRVGKGDVVFNLGDVMLPYREEDATKLLRAMNGTKHLIFGNHDPSKLGRHKQWAWTGHIRARKIADERFVLCHYALRSWPGMGKGAIHLYGHSHGNLAPGYGKSMDVGVDTRADWAPWSIDEVREVMDTAPVLIVDHHDQKEGGDEDAFE